MNNGAANSAPSTSINNAANVSRSEFTDYLCLGLGCPRAAKGTSYGGVAVALSYRKNLARIEDIQRIERLFYGNHDFDAKSVFRGQIVNFSLADAVLARACPLEAERPFRQTIEKRSGPLEFPIVARVDERHHMKIAVADMAHNGSEKFQVFDVLFGLVDT